MVSPEVVEKALKEIRKRDANYQYFFSQLKSPDWIEPLFNQGMFQRPLSPKREGDLISFPFWPESSYLARMAPEAPQAVLDVALKIPDTGNVRVHEDLAEAAYGMPADLAARLIKKEIDWIKTQPHLYLLLPELLGKLISHLSRGSQIETALLLTETLLAVLSDPREMDEKDIDTLLYPKPRARFDIFDYRQILEKHVPDLLKVAGMHTLNLLCDLLYDAVRFSRQSKEDRTPDDISHIWRPAIEDHSQNRHEDLRNLLVSAVRDAAETVIKKEGKTVLDIIERRPFMIFKRIGLHLRRIYPEVDPEGTSSLVTDPTIFDDSRLHHEVYHLLRERFTHLPMETQQAYLALVEKASEADEWRDFQEHELDQRITKEEYETFRRQWQYSKLWPIQTFLEQEWQLQFNALREEFGEPDHPDFHLYSSGATWVGPTSPKSVEDLRSMEIDELISFLKTWQPSPEGMAPSREGLGRALASIIASKPKQFAAQAAQFKELDPTYVRAFLLGLRDSKEKVSFPWQPVLDVCRWVINQPRDIPDRMGRYANADCGWVWTRKTISELLSVGFEAGIREIPFSLRTVAWEVLRPLTDDPDPGSEDESHKDRSTWDPATLSINTVRGEAMHAVIRYSLWVHRHIKKAHNGEKRIERGFDEMPEVEKILDYHLNPSNDPSLAIRAVYGQWFPWLVLLDFRWAASRVTKIFPLEEKLRDFRDAAWETYIIFCKPYDNVYDLLREEYFRAIERIGIASSERRHIADPDERLAEHLMIYYWLGKINLDEPGGLLERFYEGASEPLRSHAIEFVGRSLQQTKGKVSKNAISRLQALWQHRMNAALSLKIPFRAELAAFGWWFSSGKFDDIWAIEKLIGILKLIGEVEPDYLVVKHLARIASKMPLPAVECLSMMIEGGKKDWRDYRYSGNTRGILARALQSSEGKARETAEYLVHRLGALRYFDFRDLIYREKSERS